MPPSFSKELFRCARGKMTFNVNSCKEKDKLIYFIEVRIQFKFEYQRFTFFTILDFSFTLFSLCLSHCLSLEVVLSTRGRAHLPLLWSTLVAAAVKNFHKEIPSAQDICSCVAFKMKSYHCLDLGEYFRSNS